MPMPFKTNRYRLKDVIFLISAENTVNNNLHISMYSNWEIISLLYHQDRKCTIYTGLIGRLDISIRS